MLHNETMNVWSHLIGACVFLSLACYVIIYLKPTSLHESSSLVNRWSLGLDQGRFDQLYCDRNDFIFPKPDQCPYKPDELLDDLLETEKLLAWHSSVGA